MKHKSQDDDSTHHVTKRRRNDAKNKRDSLDSASVDVAGTSRKQAGAQSDDLVKRVLDNACKDRSKTNLQNCFNTNLPFDVLSMDSLNGLKMQEIAMLLESSNHIYSYRVDRTLLETRNALHDFSKGSVDDAEGAPKEEDEGAFEKRRKKKRMDNIAEQLDQALRMGESMDEDEGDVDEDARTLRLLATDTRRKDREDANLLDENIENKDWNPNDDLDEMISRLYESLSPHCVVDDSSLTLPSNEGETLSTNSFYQKAIRGTASAVPNFPVLQYNGVYSPDGRVFYLHPRIEDEGAGLAPDPSELSKEFLHTMHGLTTHAMQEEHKNVKDFLIPNVVNRPRVGQFNMLRQPSSIVTPSTFSSTTKGDISMTIADMTVAVPAPRTNGISNGGSNNVSPDMESTTMIEPESVPRRLMSEDSVLGPYDENQAMEPQVPPFDQILIDDLLEDFPIDDIKYRRDTLRVLFEKKVEEAENGQEISNLFRTGFFSDEWTEDLSEVFRETCALRASSVDPYIEIADLMINAEVFKMNVGREDYNRLERELDRLSEEDPTCSKKLLTLGRHVLIRPPTNYPKLYPTDPYSETEQNMFPEYCADDEELNTQKTVDPVADVSLDLSLLDAQMAEEAQRTNAIELAEVNHNAMVDVERDRLANLIIDGPRADSPALSVGGDDFGGFEDEPDIYDPDAPVALRPNAEKELMTLGKADDSHWKGSEVIAKKTEVKKKEKKERKMKRKITIEDLANYFTPTNVEDRVELTAKGRCSKPFKSYMISEDQIYMHETPSEKKPHIVFEFQNLGRSSLFSSMKYGRKTSAASARTPVSIGSSPSAATNATSTKTNNKPPSKSLSLSLCTSTSRRRRRMIGSLSLLMEKRNMFDESLDEFHATGNDDDIVVGEDGKTMDQVRQEVMSRLTLPHREQYKKIIEEAKIIKQRMRWIHENVGNTDDESDDETTEIMGMRRKLTVRNLDAAKHKKCIAEVLTNPVLSMRNIEKILTAVNGEALEEISPEGDTISPSKKTRGLSTVFHTIPERGSLEEVNRMFVSLLDAPEYSEDAFVMKTNDPIKANDADPLKDPKKRIHVAGLHTFKSALLCVPHRMKEKVEPSSMLNFSLHVANENSLRLVQDQSKINWMTDFMVLNDGDPIPDDVDYGETDVPEEVKDIWNETHDPFAKLIDPEELQALEKANARAGPSTSYDAPRAAPVPHRRRLFVDNGGRFEAVVEENEQEP
ncbi:unnamed protein product [Caenorhabditis auriculariae]|uniref:Condensin complex subunit 2 n=1 Tax=Caenorhabditis auriculariae TaxID=2777116 RepID=A0A8S1HNC8_9PELO|nr:unnamed protein product [Caenorhabditis auriculariae]